MALLISIGWLAAVFLLCLPAIAFGARLMDWWGLRAENFLEQTLFAAGLSFAILQVIVHGLIAAGWLRRAVLLVLLAVMAVVAGRGWLLIGRLAITGRAFLARARESRIAFVSTLAIAFLLILDALMAMAPLTGSDALHYHFTVPLLWLHNGFAPLFDITLSFAVGQSHMLILMGLGLGSDHIALGLILIGGVLSAASLYVLARKWMPLGWSLVATLTFLLTPIVFWQMTVAGAPDIWMVFYTTVAVLAAGRGISEKEIRWVMLAGFFAGAAAGSKFPAWAIPAGLGLMILLETRSVWMTAATALAVLLGGIWPLLRNAWWTGDPFFPFLTRWLTPHNVNPSALAAVLADTRPLTKSSGLLSWFQYPVLMVLEGQKFGVGHYFGPLVLAFAPLLVLAWKPRPLFRTAAGVWAVMLIANTLSSEMGRFLLPVFVLALAIVFAGAEAASRMERPLLRWGAAASIVIYLLFGVASYAAYAKDFLPVSVGAEGRENFLERMSPNYEEVSFINDALQGKSGTTLIFIRHTYYMRGTYVQGDFQNSWQVNPDLLGTPDAMLAWIHKYGVEWVVKTDRYPRSLREPLDELENEGILQPVAAAQVQDIYGWRIQGGKLQVSVQILKVMPGKP